ncbi:threonine synthase [Candidatus Carsonella ruddii]|uniref:threonine synthase n=1 Tax=Carsonella ruddii TaxID=114186 RepID=UPI003D8158D8
MFYNSIKNKLNIKNFIDIFFSNLSKDKNLYFPVKIPKFNKKFIFSLKNLNYNNFAFSLLRIFLKDLEEEDIFLLLEMSYQSNFFNNVIKIDKIFNNNYLLNLNNGPTLTFKDIAMIPLGNLLKLLSLKYKKKFIVFCATSGDTGASANNSLKNIKETKIFTFHPFNMISNIQRKQMTILKNKNIFNISILGNFDISQFLIKKIFEKINNNKKINLISVNSINWFRIIMQVIYYCYSSLKIYDCKKINFFIPSGNFGNALSAFIAKLLGFPIEKIVTCTNDNYFLDNFIKNNNYLNLSLKKTITPSIDISIPSNFSRIINSNFLKKHKMNYLNENFYSDKIYNKNIINSIEYFYNTFKKLYDPHTITCFSSLKKENKSENMIVSTSYPIKFIFSIKRIIPSIKLTNKLKKIFFMKEKCKIFSQNFFVLLNFIKKNV